MSTISPTHSERFQVGPGDETPREWARYVLNMVLKKDPEAAVCLDGDEWLIETKLPADALLGVRLTHPDGVGIF